MWWLFTHLCVCYEQCCAHTPSLCCFHCTLTSSFFVPHGCGFRAGARHHNTVAVEWTSRVCENMGVCTTLVVHSIRGVTTPLCNRVCTHNVFTSTQQCCSHTVHTMPAPCEQQRAHNNTHRVMLRAHHPFTHMCVNPTQHTTMCAHTIRAHHVNTTNTPQNTHRVLCKHQHTSQQACMRVVFLCSFLGGRVCVLFFAFFGGLVGVVVWVVCGFLCGVFFPG